MTTTKTYDPGTYQIMNILSANKKTDKIKAKKEVNEEKIISRMYAICRKYNKALDEITKKELTKTEYKHIVNFLNLKGYIYSDILEKLEAE